MIEQTLVLFKPDAVQKNLTGTILARFERKGLTIKGLKMMQLDDTILASHYAAHTDKPFFPQLCDYMKQGPIVALALEGEDAVAVVRQMCGATNPLNAAAGTIRGDFAKNMDNNIVHSSDSLESAKEEVARFFSSAEIFDYGRMLSF